MSSYAAKSFLRSTSAAENRNSMVGSSFGLLVATVYATEAVVGGLLKFASVK